jgi:hypothetical protein
VQHALLAAVVLRGQRLVQGVEQARAVIGLTSTTSASAALEISSMRSRAKALTITTMGWRWPLAACRMALAVARPSMPGMCQSASTTS